MKISLGSKIVEGPWGGGNFFLINLKNYLEKKGHEVVFDLCHSDIDVILFTDPRPKIYSSSTISYKDIQQYKKYVNKNGFTIADGKNIFTIADVILKERESTGKVISETSYCKIFNTVTGKRL